METEFTVVMTFIQSIRDKWMLEFRITSLLENRK